MRGIVERTRVAIVEVAGKSGSVTEYDSTTDYDTMTDDLDMNMDDDATSNVAAGRDTHDDFEMQIARVYEHTMVELGVSLDSSPEQTSK